MKYQTKALKNRGFLRFLEAHLVMQFLAPFNEGEEFRITIEKIVPKTYKTYNQLKMIHAIIKLIDKETGNNCLTSTKEDVKRHIGYVTYELSPITNKDEERFKSFKGLTKEEGIEVINQLLGLCEFLSIFVPPDADYDYWMNL